MTEYQRLFLIQARTDFAVFELFRKTADFPSCHALHYLQMATELLGKAHAWKQGAPAKKTHRAFVRFLRSLATNKNAQTLLGFQGLNANWTQLIRKGVLLAERVEDLAPALSNDGPNPEYPWPDHAPHAAPAEHDFEIWKELRETSGGRKFLEFIKKLMGAAEQFL